MFSDLSTVFGYFFIIFVKTNKFNPAKFRNPHKGGVKFVAFLVIFEKNLPSLSGINKVMGILAVFCVRFFPHRHAAHQMAGRGEDVPLLQFSVRQ